MYNATEKFLVAGKGLTVCQMLAHPGYANIVVLPDPFPRAPKFASEGHEVYSRLAILACLSAVKVVIADYDGPSEGVGDLLGCHENVLP